MDISLHGLSWAYVKDTALKFEHKQYFWFKYKNTAHYFRLMSLTTKQD